MRDKPSELDLTCDGGYLQRTLHMFVVRRSLLGFERIESHCGQDGFVEWNSSDDFFSSKATFT